MRTLLHFSKVSLNLLASSFTSSPSCAFIKSEMYLTSEIIRPYSYVVAKRLRMG